MTSPPGAPMLSTPPLSLAEHLQNVTEALAATSVHADVLRVVLDPALRALGALAGSVLLLDAEARHLNLHAQQGYVPDSPVIWQDGPVGHKTPATDVLRSREALYFEHAGELKALYPQLESHTGALAAVATAVLPMFLDGRPLGTLVLDFTEPHTFTPEERQFLRTLASQCAVALGRADSLRTLERHLAERTRKIDEAAQAQAAFVAFTEMVGSETDVQALVRQAIALLQTTCDVEAAHFERDGEVYKVTAWSSQFAPLLLPLMRRGFPLQHSGIAQLLHRNTAAFIDDWRGTGLLIQETEVYQAVAGYPYMTAGRLESVLMIGSLTTATWDKRTRGIFRAVGRSLDLALDRARQTRTVTAQRDALETRTQELAETTRELEAFSYSVSHDLRTPVRHMLGFLLLARKSLDGRLDERSARHLDMVEKAGTQMNTLIDALLDLSRTAQQTLRPGVVDLGAVMSRLRHELLPDLLSREIHWDVEALPHVWGDHDALTQVLTQLTENALKFTRSRRPAVIRVWAEDHGTAWKVNVADNGLGFDPRYQHRLFNLFQRLHTEKEASGTGVGLASVRRLILKHGGEVFAEGRVGEGATFSFTLPKTPRG